MTDDRDRAVFEALVRRHARGLYSFAYRLAGDAAAAEDLVQETYLHAWRSIGRLRDPAAARAWLATILRHRWAHRLRDDSRRPRLETGGDAPDPLDDEASPLPGPDAALLGAPESVQRALDRLDARFREAFLLVFLEGLTCAETAERLSVPLGTVLSRVHRARVSLREILRSEGRRGSRRSASGGEA